MKSKKKLAELMSVLGTTFGKEVDQLLNRIYWQCFRSFSDEEVEKAVSKALMTLRFFPKPAEIIDLIPVKKPQQIKGHDAWGMVMSGLESGREPQAHEIQEGIRRIGGWQWLQEQTYDELHWLEKRFLEHFENITSSSNFLIESEERKLLDL